MKKLSDFPPGVERIHLEIHKIRNKMRSEMNGLIKRSRGFRSPGRDVIRELFCSFPPVNSFWCAHPPEERGPDFRSGKKEHPECQ
ncbi:hypothetical protein CDAR_284081 [Caerostris darwini]|uniref:Uncharacterized protein n=1 Tax=Caerostris darwini TaxID=1538125 RepID=A0AAV4PMZ6_9ARAC|nr:hypothetical protein CDAR_284081 [Caerostris darwini]